eukprot:scaffold65755_cov61-Phaeocystis_antarctica.AAC.2
MSELPSTVGEEQHASAPLTLLALHCPARELGPYGRWRRRGQGGARLLRQAAAEEQRRRPLAQREAQPTHIARDGARRGGEALELRERAIQPAQPGAERLLLRQELPPHRLARPVVRIVSPPLDQLAADERAEQLLLHLRGVLHVPRQAAHVGETGGQRPHQLAQHLGRDGLGFMVGVDSLSLSEFVRECRVHA